MLFLGGLNIAIEKNAIYFTIFNYEFSFNSY